MMWGLLPKGCLVAHPGAHTVCSPFPDKGFPKSRLVSSPQHDLLPSVLSAERDQLCLQTTTQVSVSLLVSTKSNIYQNASKFDDFISNAQHAAAAIVSSFFLTKADANAAHCEKLPALSGSHEALANEHWGLMPHGLPAPQQHWGLVMGTMQTWRCVYQ